MWIDPSTLTDQQYFGLACVVDGHVFRAVDDPVRVGWVADDLHAVFACAGDCASSLSQLATDREPVVRGSS